MGPWAILMAVALFSSFTTTVLVGGIIHGFTRETTGINERWQGRSMAERQGLVDRVGQLNITPNVSANPDQNPNDPNGDFDGDGLTNGNEDGSGTESKNPDTDGDGVADGIEVQNGTNPTDPASGGLTTPPVFGKTTTGQTVLIIDTVTKTVNGKHYVETTTGSTLNFHIHVQATKYGRAKKYLEIVDHMPSGIVFQSGRVESTFGNSELTGWTGSKRYLLQNSGVYTFDFYFTTQITAAGYLENVAKAFDSSTPFNSVDDTVYIVATPGGNPPNFEYTNLTYVGKEGKTRTGSIWKKEVFGKAGDIIDFKLTALTGTVNPESTISIQDALPPQLQYLHGSTRLYINGSLRDSSDAIANQLLGSGYTIGTSKASYEILFSAKLGSDLLSDATNYLNGFVDGIAIRQSSTRITPRP